MSGIMNNTARQYNLKTITSNNQRVVVRLAPGFNVVEDAHWEAFVSKDGKKVDPYVKQLKKEGLIDFGKKMDDMELEMEPDTVSKSKAEPMAKLQKQLSDMSSENEELKKEAEKAKAEAEKLKAEAEKVKAEAEKLKAEAEKTKAEAEKLEAEGDK